MLTVYMYTDGAVKNNGGPGSIGCAAVLIQVKKEGSPRVLRVSYKEDLEYATNNKAELRAILLGIDSIREDLRYKIDLTIFSDSQWAIKSIIGEFKATKNIAQINYIRELLEKFSSFSFIWVEGHTGNTWNEEANMLAQKACGTWKGK